MSERRGKYNARPVELDGIRFDSQAEFSRWAQLLLMAHAGQITDLTPHPRFTVWDGVDSAGKRERITYVGDFSYVEGGRLVVEDVKGVETGVFKLKAKLFRCMFPEIELRIIKGGR